MKPEFARHNEITESREPQPAFHSLAPMLKKIVCGACLLALPALPAWARHKPIFILSAPLPIIENRRLEIQLPPDLKLDSAPDQDQDWQPVEANAECSLQKPRDGLDGVVIEIIRWPITRPEGKGDLSGAVFKTPSGIEGIRIENRMEDDQKPRCFSALMIYNSSRTGAIFIKILPRPEVRVGTQACLDIGQLGTEIFDGVRLVK